ncbi:SMP-30/gluconolactonase/LRE family protein [Saccharicrinis aurantiacus]|uniref:SMP-30/gluconolactonase/LRE family protein n=1 Tax=Saccharicrinis aurantiacus TaxID=1849719 RepID=UPI0024915C33|nr:SMP-30/gluconolactonase/LRE family protein [Saccharicrinis aurantiacus]
MKVKIFLQIVIACLFFTNKLYSQNSATSKFESAPVIIGEVEKLAGGFVFTEGPAVDKEGNVFFTDVRQHLIMRWSINQELDTFKVNSGRANGLYFDKKGNLLVCEGEKGQITSISRNGDYKIVASEYKGIRFNQPNDIWVDKKGGVYFTDPLYGGNDSDILQDGMHVYHIHPKSNIVTRVCDDLEKPNGLIGAPDGKTLYVTDAQAGKTYKYDIDKNGVLQNKTLFVGVGCDGMTIDIKNNVYITPRGESTVDVYSPSGELVNSIKIPERPTNVCFGGENRNHLFITARTSIYRVELTVGGVE